MTIRKILHFDADAFYASLEIRENPALKDRPVAVGGRPEQRGVIATCNYEARRYGVRSAMASATAMRLCPHLQILPPRFELYRSVSRQMHEIFAEYSHLIEPLSLDEAYLDVSDSTQCNGSATLIAREIKQRIKEELRITVSAGAAPNKFLAKVASDWQKPDGLFVITPDQVEAFVYQLPVSRINGVGKVTASRLKDLGIETCGDLQRLTEVELVEHFGKHGRQLFQAARGIDLRPVDGTHVRKSISVEHTYQRDLPDLAAVQAHLPPLLEELRQRCDRKQLQDDVVAKRLVKIKFADFTQTTLEQAVNPYQPWDVLDEFSRLMTVAWHRGGKPVRLLGVGVRLRDASGPSGPQVQLSLFDD